MGRQLQVSGREEVDVARFPQGDSIQQVSSEGGTTPAWSRDGRELFFITPTANRGGQATPITMMATPVSSGNTLRVGTPQVVRRAIRIGAIVRPTCAHAGQGRWSALLSSRTPLDLLP